jgi:hypothetical protein
MPMALLAVVAAAAPQLAAATCERAHFTCDLRWWIKVRSRLEQVPSNANCEAATFGVTE